MPNGDLDLADMDFNQPSVVGFIPELDEEEYPTNDKDVDANG
jgi:hypothetical protein